MTKINSPQEQLLKSQDQQLKSLNKQLNKKIASKEQEIENINEFYKGKKSAINESSKLDLVKISEDNQKRLLKESEAYEEKIQSYRDKLEHVQGSIQREENNLKMAKNTRLNGLKADLDATFDAQAQEAIDNQNALIHSTKSIVKENNEKARIEKNSIQNQTTREIQAYSIEQNNKMNDNEQSFKKMNDDLIKKNEIESRQLQNELRLQRTATNTKNQRIDNETARINEQSIDFKQRHHQNQLAQLEKDFKTKYENMTREHNQILKDISDKLDVDVAKVINETSTQKQLIENKSADDFYRVSVLRPKIEDLGREILVSLPVAEHERTNVFLSTGDRNVKITLSRNYHNMLKEDDQSLNKSTRSELFSKEFETSDILNPRGITQKYENGILSFKILKA